jgi:hypothetical protein
MFVYNTPTLIERVNKSAMRNKDSKKRERHHVPTYIVPFIKSIQLK